MNSRQKNKTGQRCSAVYTHFSTTDDTDSHGFWSLTLMLINWPINFSLIQLPEVHSMRTKTKNTHNYHILCLTTDCRLNGLYRNINQLKSELKSLQWWIQKPYKPQLWAAGSDEPRCCKADFPCESKLSQIKSTSHHQPCGSAPHTGKNTVPLRYTKKDSRESQLSSDRW